VDGSEPEEGVPTDTLTREQLQQIYDPKDDPTRLVGQTADGDARIVELALSSEMADPDGFPSLEEAGVQTPHDYLEYLVAFHASNDEREP
jgi:hypothetical protein